MISNLKKYGVYFLVGVIGGITVILFGLILQNNIEMTEIIKITISIIALFSTFGGAYLGAKISGNNARKLAKKESMISDLNRTYEYNYVVLEKFNNSLLRSKIDYLKEMDRINDYLDVNNLYEKIIGINQGIDGILKNNEFNYVFPLISLNFNELKHEMIKLESSLSKSMEYCHKELDKIIKSYGYNEFEIIEYESRFLTLDENRNLKVNFNTNSEEDIFLKVNEVKDLQVPNINEINETIYEIIIFWENFKFKSNEDIREYIANYYRDF
ncbi:hypothetical protein [Staphylococcus aureus]|uniref:hypothetical protein n=1 Tax=Staphylococcus aureus TaxID=1280 RepID=UPI00066CC6FC|nr:hypothetical protein [Staphylococcus aureus]MEB2863617.1 hypothetical protein [Staphylococcus aureus]WQC02928.1 hypothetical protein U0320_08015 [Staphylococcus aureus]HDP6050689.1 hypothetical protein [Staphylococcus aureus]